MVLHLGDDDRLMMTLQGLDHLLPEVFMSTIAVPSPIEDGLYPFDDEEAVTENLNWPRDCSDGM